MKGYKIYCHNNTLYNRVVAHAIELGYVPYRDLNCKVHGRFIVLSSEGYIDYITFANGNSAFTNYMRTRGEELTVEEFLEVKKEIAKEGINLREILLPFTPVLVRDTENELWRPWFFATIINNDLEIPFKVVGGSNYRYCIPYNGNEDLIYTTNNSTTYYYIK